jgi:hypothetical protein
MSIALHPATPIKTNSIGLALDHRRQIQNGCLRLLYVHVRFLIRNGNFHLLCLMLFSLLLFI